MGKNLSVVLLVLVACSLATTQVLAALPGPRSSTVSGDVFLGGDYIELGISQYGSFGTDQNKPEGFFGTAARNNIGMSSDLDGFDTGTDWRMDFFMPGTQEERWSVGYKISDVASTASNARRAGTTNITDNTVTNQSEGSLLKATSVGTFNSNLRITQVISFNAGDKFFKNVVTLENIGSQNLDSVRYMRSFDPDNTVDKSGSYTTRNSIVYTHLAGDGKAVVKADTSNTDSDPVYVGTGGASGGTRSPIFFYSSDSRARVNYHPSLNPGTVYAPATYDSVNAKGAAETRDGAISITFDVGTLAPAQSESVTYYTSLDNRDFSEVEQQIEEDEAANAPQVGEPNTDTTSSSATVSWATDVAASSQLEYGLTRNLGFSSPETNTSPRVTNHQVTITGLKSCARYFYRTRSTSEAALTAYSEIATFQTSGCDLSTIKEGTESAIPVGGGSVRLEDSEVNVQLDIPAGFNDKTTSFQINKLQPNGLQAPSGKSIVGAMVFDLIAVDSDDVQVSEFDTNLTLVIGYADKLNGSVDENSLDLYKFTGSGWEAKGCQRDTAAKTLTCTLPSFSVYAVFGNSIGGSLASSTSSGSSCQVGWLGTPDLFQIDTSHTGASLYFTPVMESPEYFVSYSTGPHGEEHGALVRLGSDGVQRFDVGSLASGTTYYFKVRSNKDCASGPWSSIKAATTRSHTSTLIPIVQPQPQQDQIPEVSKEPLGTKVQDSTPLVSKESGLHDVVVVVEDKGVPVGGVQVMLDELGRSAVTDDQGRAVLTQVPKGATVLSVVGQAFASESEIVVDGPETEFDVLVKVESKTNLIPDWLWAVVVVLLILLLIVGRRRSTHREAR